MSDEPKLASDLRAFMVAGKHSTRHQPTASADAEQVWQEALSAAAMSPRSRGASFDPDQAAADVIQAYGDARADAARQEGAWEAGKEINALKDALAQARAEIAELKDATDADRRNSRRN